MFSFSPISLFNFSFGASVTGVGKLGSFKGEPGEDQIVDLTIPWHDLLPSEQLFPLLSWHTQSSKFTGRDQEIDKLHKWVESDHRIWVKFVIGAGGVGKSRLGAEFAERMQKKKWAAGFVNLKKPLAFRMKKAGSLLVIDYPEENIEAVKELLHDLTQLAPKVSKLRILFLTRLAPENWEEVIASSHARTIADPIPITLHPPDGDDARIIYNSTLSIATEQFGQGGAPVGEEMMNDWMKIAPENDRPLFIMAAAVYSARHPHDEAIRFKGRDVVKSLATRELDRVRNAAEGMGFKDKYAFARLLAMAAIADELTVSDIESLIANTNLQMGFPPEIDIRDTLSTAGILIDGSIHAPKPDIVAAAFVVDVLRHGDKQAPEYVWAALEKDIEGGWERIGRLCYDAEVVLGILEPCISDWLADAVRGKIERCKPLEAFLGEGQIQIGLLKAAIVVYKTLLQSEKGKTVKFNILLVLSNHLSGVGAYKEALSYVTSAVALSRNLVLSDATNSEYYLGLSLTGLSNRLSENGDTAGALNAIKEARDIFQRLVAATPARFEPDLAMSLNNLSNCLSVTVDSDGALAASKEAVELYRGLAAASPEEFEADLAASMNNLSGCLSETGDTDGALDAIKEAVVLYRKLATASPERFEPDLAMSLDNLSIFLSDTGDSDGALAASKEAVVLYRNLAVAGPDKFKPDLAMSLDDLARCLSDTGDSDGALAASKEAVELYRGLAAASPEEFEPDLAMSLNNLSNRVSDTGDKNGALDAIKEAVEIYRKLATASPERFEPDLAGSLNNLSIRLSDTGDKNGALEAIKEAVEIYRKLATASPERFEPDLAMSLDNLARCLSDTGDSDGAIAASKEAVELYRGLTAASSEEFEADLASSLNDLSINLDDADDKDGALAASKEAVELYRKLTTGNPEKFSPHLAMILSNLSVDLNDTGDYNGALKASKEAMEIHRRLAAASPERFEPDLAMSLNNLSCCLSDTGDTDRALDVIKEAVELCRKVAAASPEEFEPDLAHCLWSYGDLYNSLEDFSNAEKCYKESIDLIKPYAEKLPKSESEEIYEGVKAAYQALKEKKRVERYSHATIIW